MLYRLCLLPIFVFFALDSSIHADSDSLSIFLCTGGSTRSTREEHSGTPQPKLVYGYINGKKTSCMTEYELRVAWANARLAREKEKAAKKRRWDAVYHGEKNLAYADLRGFDLKDIDLSGADLTKAHLESADLRGANLKNASLSGANLENAYCKNADFSGADLSTANLRGAFFHHANLSTAKGLTMENLPAVATLYKARLEDQLLKMIQETCSDKLKNPQNKWNRVIYPTPGGTASSK